jgi:uncharacterized protein YgiM (DUF1202 family)
MSSTTHRLVTLAAVTLFGSLLGLGACAPSTGEVDSDELVGADETVQANGEALSGAIAVGTTLVSTADVNLRSGPSTSKSILHVVPEGSTVTVVEGSPQNGFYKVKHNGTTGWSYGQYYNVKEGSAGSIPVGTTLVSTTDVNLRKGPSTSDAIIHVVSQGSTVKVLDSTPQNGFYKVDHNGTVGWSFGQYYTESAGGGGGGGGSSVRDAAIVRAKSGVGFSYWWGHGRFRPEGPNGSNNGSCSGSCPNCSHSGSYGGDCSGFAAKVWQVPGSNTDLTVDSHPYSTVSFNQDSAQWKTVSRGNVQKADAMVYNENGAGHIFIYSSGDGWGSMYSYECKGCSAGCVYNLRTASNSYHAIRKSGW